jgi:DNA-binding transcriptional LysR family regulator
MDRLQTMKTFVRVVDEGSFAAAARLMNVDQAIVTRQVADLERHLSVKLLERTTRSMRLTEAGETFLARCRDILSDVVEAEAQVSQSHQAMTGRVRIAIPTLFGKESLAQQLAGLLLDYPDLTVDMAFIDRPVDPVAEGFDVVITDAAYGVSSLAVARALAAVPFLLCASTAYVARKGLPQTPADLASHHAVAQWISGEPGAAVERWTLEEIGGRAESVTLPVALRTNTYALSLEGVRAGIGIGRFTPRMLADDFALGRLVPVLPGWHAGSMIFNLVYPGRRLIPRRVRHVIDNIVEQGRLHQAITPDQG